MEVKAFEAWIGGKRVDGGGGDDTSPACRMFGSGRGLDGGFSDVSSSPDEGDGVSLTLVSSVAGKGFEEVAPLRRLKIDKKLRYYHQLVHFIVVCFTFTNITIHLPRISVYSNKPFVFLITFTYTKYI